MNRTTLAAAALCTSAAAGIGVGHAMSAAAAPDTARAAATAGTTAGTVTLPGKAAADSTVLTRSSAQRLANAAQRACASDGYHVTVAVVDRDGVQIVTTRDEVAPGATVATAIGKAYAAVGFQISTAQQQQGAKTQPGWLQVPGFVILPGGQPIWAGGELVGGIGVSGAPGGDLDDACIDQAKKAF